MSRYSCSRHAGHAAGHLLEALAVGRADLGEEIDVAAELDAAVEVARKDGLLLLLAHLPFVYDQVDHGPTLAGCE